MSSAQLKEFDNKHDQKSNNELKDLAKTQLKIVKTVNENERKSHLGEIAEIKYLWMGVKKSAKQFIFFIIQRNTNHSIWK